MSSAICLVAKRVEKPWGRRDLGAFFGTVAPEYERVGEIWFAPPLGANAREPELLVKYLFTGQPLSVQVHPDDAAAQASGYPCGKDEAWVVVAAEPGAVIGLGPRALLDRDQLRGAALDGSIETLIDWRPVHSGDVLYAPAGTIHAIGAGLVVIEVQQNVDLTYRLYDYGSARALQLDEAVAVAQLAVYQPASGRFTAGPGREILVGGPKFVLERWQRRGEHRLAASASRPVWVIPLDGGATLDTAPLVPGEVWLADAPGTLHQHEGSTLLLAYAGATLLADGE